jgi:hypothetical protein
MLYLVKSYLKGNKFIYKIGFSEDSNIETRLSSYFYMSPGSEIISLRQGDELLENLIHYYLYYLGYRYQKNNKLDEWFIGDPEVLSIFHISRESLERKLWKYRDKIFNIDKIKSDKSLDLQLFKYLYVKNKDNFVGERYIVTENKEIIKLNPKGIDIVFYNSLLKYFPEEIIKLPNISEYQSDLEKEVQDFLDNKFYSTGIFREKMKMYCEFMDKHNGNKEVSDIIYFKIKNSDFRKYYNFYGTSGCSAKKYQKENLELGMIDISKSDELSSVIYKKFKVNSRYTLKEIKSTLQDIYRDLGITSKPKATDLDKYFSLTRIKFSDPKTKKRIEGYLLNSLY